MTGLTQKKKNIGKHDVRFVRPRRGFHCPSSHALSPCHLPVKKSEVWPLPSLLPPPVDPCSVIIGLPQLEEARLRLGITSPPHQASLFSYHGTLATNAGAHIRRLPRCGRVRTLLFIYRGMIMMLIDWLAPSWWYTVVVIALRVCRVPFFILLTVRLISSGCVSCLYVPRFTPGGTLNDNHLFC